MKITVHATTTGVFSVSGSVCWGVWCIHFYHMASKQNFTTNLQPIIIFIGL